MRGSRLGAVVAALLLVLTSCGGTATTAPGAPANCIDRFDPARDYFPVHSTVEYSRNFSLRYERSYQVLTVNQPYPGGPPQSYVLLRCGAPKPQLPPALADAQVIPVPVRTMYSASTTQLPSDVELGVLDSLTGVWAPPDVSDPTIVARIRSGAIVGFGGQGRLDIDAIVAAAPTVVLSEGYETAGYEPVRAAGIPVLHWADYLDGSPLGQAEWIKVTAALTGKETEAAAAFDRVAARYREVAALAKGVAPTPVIVGQPYQGNWAVPSGGSTVGTALGDAGATWSGVGSSAPGSQPRDLEYVLATDGRARIWLANGPWRTRADLLASDPRFAGLGALQPGGQVWTGDKRIGPGGGNDIYERGVAHPDEILEDLVAILHPELRPGHRFTYYQRVAGQ